MQNGNRNNDSAVSPVEETLRRVQAGQATKVRSEAAFQSLFWLAEAADTMSRLEYGSSSSGGLNHNGVTETALALGPFRPQQSVASPEGLQSREGPLEAISGGESRQSSPHEPMVDNEENTVNTAVQSHGGSDTPTASLPAFPRRYLSSLPPSQHLEEKLRRQTRAAEWYAHYVQHGATIRPKYKAFGDDEIAWLMEAANRHRKDWTAILEEHKRVFPHVQPPRTKSSISTKWRRQRVQLGHGVRLSDLDRPAQMLRTSGEASTAAGPQPRREASPKAKRAKRMKR